MVRAWLWTVCLLIGCQPPSSLDAGVDAPSDAGPPLGPFPTVEALPARPLLPELFVNDEGRTVTGTADWNDWRRAELLERFAFYLYGYVPEDPVTVEVTSLAVVDDFVVGAVRYEELEVTVQPIGLVLHVALFSPMDGAAAPVFVAPNRCGNQEVSTDPRIRATTAWMGDNCGATVEASRGVRASHWPVETIVRAGYAFATFHESELDPDDTDEAFDDGVHALLREEERDPRLRWGRIAAWAWGVSRVVDALVTQPRIDPARIAAVGHSRRGKTVLLAGARDPRIALVVAHQSGTGGAALTRHLEGESVAAINLAFPAWFDDVFGTFADHEDRIPVDQHQLIALLAPRPVLISDGDDDLWADPVGARTAVEAASPAWELFGVPGLVSDAGGPTLDGTLAWHTRPGGHELTHADWDTFLAFAASHGFAP